MAQNNRCFVPWSSDYRHPDGFYDLSVLSSHLDRPPGASMEDGEVVDSAEGHSAREADGPDSQGPPRHRCLLPPTGGEFSGRRVGAGALRGKGGSAAGGEQERPPSPRPRPRRRRHFLLFFLFRLGGCHCSPDQPSPSSQPTPPPASSSLRSWVSSLIIVVWLIRSRFLSPSSKNRFFGLWELLFLLD